MLLYELRSETSFRAFLPLDSLRHELVDAIADTTERTKELVQLKLARLLPISVSAILALPFILHALSVRAAVDGVGDALARRQLAVYTKTMRLQQALYDGTDFVYLILENVQNYAKEEHLEKLMEDEPPKHGGAKPVATRSTDPPPELHASRARLAWVELMVRRPRSYLRLILHVDVALCTGHPPNENDFPRELRRPSAPA